MRLVDSHCHLDVKYRKSDDPVTTDDLVRGANANGVSHLVSISTDLDNCQEVVSIAEKYQCVFATVGIHPLNVKDKDFDQDVIYKTLHSFTQHPKVIGLGETGLDFYKNENSRDIQIASLEVHIKLAQDTGLPLIIHTRSADEETVSLLKARYREREFSGVIHCFTASYELAQAMVDIGFYISASGIVTFKNAKDIQDSFKKIPLDRILVESDAPFLAPVPHRGRPNRPEYTIHTANFMADLLEISAQEFYQQTTNNFFNLFKKSNI